MDKALLQAFVFYHKHEMLQIVELTDSPDVKQRRASRDIAFFVQAVLQCIPLPSRTRGEVQDYLDLYCVTLDINIPPHPLLDDGSSPTSQAK